MLGMEHRSSFFFVERTKRKLFFSQMIYTNAIFLSQVLIAYTIVRTKKNAMSGIVHRSNLVFFSYRK